MFFTTNTLLIAFLFVQLSVRAVGEQHGVHHLVEAVGDAVAVAFAYLVNGEVGGDDGGQTVLVAVVEQFADGRDVSAEDVDINRLNSEVVYSEQGAFFDFVELGVLELVELVQFDAVEAFEADLNAMVLYVLGGEEIGDGVEHCGLAAADVAVEQQACLVLVGEPFGGLIDAFFEVVVGDEGCAACLDFHLNGEGEFRCGFLGCVVLGLKRPDSVGLSL